MSYYLEQSERQLKELELQNEALSRETSDYFKSLGLKPEELPNLFKAPEERATLEAFQKARDAELQRDLDSIRDQRELKKRREAQGVLPPHALFIR